MFLHWLKKVIVLICVLFFAGGGFFRSKICHHLRLVNAAWYNKGTGFIRNFHTARATSMLPVIPTNGDQKCIQPKRT